MNDTITTEQEQQPRTVRLTPAEFAATQAKIAKINERAAKRGFTGTLAVQAERVEQTKTDELGFKVTQVFYETAITGEAPKYNGWTFLARIDRVGESFTIATAPGVEHVSRDLVRVGECDHCGYDRQRNNTYLVVNEAGETRNVGSTCIKDFLGWSGSFAFISEDEVKDDLFEGGYGYVDPQYTFETVVAVSYAAIRVFGWVPASQDWNTPTKQHVSTILSGKLPKDRNGRTDADYLKARDYVAEAEVKAAEVVRFIGSDDFSGNSTYVDNLKALAATGLVEWRQIGLAASAPQAYIRHLETAAERAAKEARWAAEKDARVTSEYIGQPKDKVEFKGTVSAIRFIEGNYGTTVLYTITTTDGNLVKWFASSEALGDTEGVEVHLRATVKDHDEYNGQKSTVVTRAAKMNPATGKPFSAKHTNDHYRSEWSEAEGRRVWTHELQAHPDCEICATGDNDED